MVKTQLLMFSLMKKLASLTGMTELDYQFWLLTSVPC